MSIMEALSGTSMLPWWEILIRLLSAMIIGCAVGAEREYSNHPAGMRTYTLVCLGACVVMIAGELIFREYTANGGSTDPARLPAQVIAGVGFLGAGTILRDGTTVKGLTTAAGIWVVACLGVAAGGGYYLLAGFGCAAVLCTLEVVEKIQKILISRRQFQWDVTLVCTDLPAAMKELKSNAVRDSAKISSLHVEKNTGDGYRVSFRLEFTGKDKIKHIEDVWVLLAAMPDLTPINVKEYKMK